MLYLIVNVCVSENKICVTGRWIEEFPIYRRERGALFFTHSLLSLHIDRTFSELFGKLSFSGHPLLQKKIYNFVIKLRVLLLMNTAPCQINAPFPTNFPQSYKSWLFNLLRRRNQILVHILSYLSKQDFNKGPNRCSQILKKKKLKARDLNWISTFIVLARHINYKVEQKADSLCHLEGMLVAP